MSLAKFVDLISDDYSLKMTFTVPIGGRGVQTENSGSPWYNFQNIGDAASFVADKLGTEIGTASFWMNVTGTPSTPHDIATNTKLNTTVRKYGTKYSTAGAGGGEVVAGKFLRSAKVDISDPDVDFRWVKFTDSLNYTVYAKDKTTVIATGSLPADSDYSTHWYFAVDDWDGFINAASVGDAHTHVATGNILFEGGDSAFPQVRGQVFGGAGNIVTAYDWIYYLAGGSPIGEDAGDDPYAPGGTGGYLPSMPGGGGSPLNPYDRGDDIPYPDDPPISIADTGLITLYTPSQTQLNLLAADLWSSNFVQSLVKDLYADPMDVIISLGFYPFNITPGGTKNIKVGDRDTNISSNVPQSKYFNFDAGSVDLRPALGAYTDFAPYTKGTIFIPYVGYCPLDIDTFMGQTISLKYKVDLCTGSAVAYLMGDNKVYQQYACNLLTVVPLSGANYADMWGSLLSATATLAGAGITAGTAGGAATAAEAAKAEKKALSQAASGASDMLNAITTKPVIQKSNDLGATAGLLGNPYAYITLERPNCCIPTTQASYMGYPSFINRTLSELRGFTRVSSIKLGIGKATAPELTEIETILKQGFYINGGTVDTPSGGIRLAQNGSANNTIGKSVTTVQDLTGYWRDAVDIINPVIRIERSSAVGFNYVYIADFDRWYYVDEVNATNNNVLELHLSVDVLQSFAPEILAHSAILDKQEHVYNLYLNDDSIKVYQNPLVSTWKFPNQFFADGNFEFALIVAGS